jgi:hypothetical protein
MHLIFADFLSRKLLWRNTVPLAQPKKLLVEFYDFALENDELSQNVINRFVVGACKFANPE